MTFQVNKVQHLYQRMMGLEYSAQVELVKELREKDADFVDTLNVSVTIFLRDDYDITPDFVSVADIIHLYYNSIFPQILRLEMLNT